MFCIEEVHKLVLYFDEHKGNYGNYRTLSFERKSAMKRYITIAFITMILLLCMSINVFAANESESNDSKDNATAIAVNSITYGNLSKSNDVDWYKFTVSQNGYFSVSFSHTTLDNSRTYWVFRLYDSSGSSYIDGVSSSYSVYGNSDITTNTYGVKAGTYYIKITDDYYSDAQYSIKVNFTAASNWETENNNSKDTADEIKVNSEYNGALTTSSDVDWYKFTVSQNGYFNVTFSHDALENSRNYWVLRLYDGTGASYIDGISSSYSVAGNANVTTNTFGIKAGTYYIKVNDDYHSGIPYKIKVNFTAASNWETENNNSKDTADEIKVNSSYNGALTTSSDVDWFKFTVSSKCDVAISFDHAALEESRTYWYIYIYDSAASSKLLTFSSQGNVSNKTSDYVSLSSGTYYVKIQDDYHSGINYSIVVKERHDCNGPWKVVKNATCDQNGQREQTCDICGRVSKTETIPATGHKYGEWVIDRNPSCSKEGERHAKCSVCGTNKKEAIATLAHTYSDWKVVEEPTCDTVGKSQGTCSECGAFVTEDVAKLTHEYTDWETVKAATCTENGTERRECKLCSLSETRNVEAYTHHYGDWEIVGGNKLIPPIVKEKRCEFCDDTQVYKDWSYSWIAIVAVVVLIGATIGIVNYVKAFKKTRN